MKSLQRNLNFFLMRDNQILVESDAIGIKLIFDSYREVMDDFKAATVTDMIIGKAALYIFDRRWFRLPLYGFSQ